MSAALPLAPHHSQVDNIPPSKVGFRASHTAPHYNKQPLRDSNRTTMNGTAHPSTPPRTPQKMAALPQGKVPQSAAVPESASKPKSRGKPNRGKSGGTTPAGRAMDRGTPTTRAHSGPQSSVTKPTMTPAVAAYAGPTFHASPAPSALPIPSFFSKSVPESPSVRASEAQLQHDDSGSSGGDSPTPGTAKLAQDAAREESPLDFFFNADRAEKARARSANSSSGPFQPPPATGPTTFRTPLPTDPNRVRPYTGGSANIFAMELDGTPRSGSFGPAFATPYQERISAARSSPSHSPAARDRQKQTDRSEALKSFLFAGPKAQPATGGEGVALEPQEDTRYNMPAGPDPSRAAHSGCDSPQRPANALFNEGSHFNNGSNGLRGSHGFSHLRRELSPTKTPERHEGYPPLQTDPRQAQYGSGFGPNVHSGNVGAIQTQAGAPPYPAHSVSQQKQSDIRSMEDSLRRILRLEPAANASSANVQTNNNASSNQFRY